MDINGIAMNESFIYVTDKAQNYLFKIDIKTYQVIEQLEFLGSPFDVCFNSSVVVVSDSTRHELHLVKPDSLNSITYKTIGQANEYFKGPFNVTISEDNFIVVKSCTKTDAYVFDLELKFITKFNYEDCELYDLKFVNSINSLVLGFKDKSHQYFLVLYSLLNWKKKLLINWGIILPKFNRF